MPPRGGEDETRSEFRYARQPPPLRSGILKEFRRIESSGSLLLFVAGDFLPQHEISPVPPWKICEVASEMRPIAELLRKFEYSFDMRKEFWEFNFGHATHFPQ